MAEDDRSPEDDFQELLRQLFGGAGGAGGPDPDQLAQLRAMGVDPAMMQNMMQQLHSAFRSAPSGGISWDVAKQQALHIANQGDLGITAGQRGEFDQAFTLAGLWLGEATTIAELAEPARAITRGGWVQATLPVWQELAEPVATSIADALTEAMRTQAPEEMRAIIQGASQVMRTIAASLFATQLGQVIGRLSLEVVTGGDVGIPVMPSGQAAILPQNFADFGRDLEVPDDQLALYLATRELAHARLFRHARWLRLHVITQVTEFARGLHVDTAALEELASRFDPSDPEELRTALQNGALLPARTDAQAAALTRLENLLALIEGWVDVVTADATGRLPSAARIAEAVRRRRAVGGPAEKALGSLVGLELRPRRMREAAAMWRAVTDAVGIGDRDALWDYPDLMPEASDIDDPSALIQRLQARARGEQPQRDEMDDALDALLRGDVPRLEDQDTDTDAGTGDADTDGDTGSDRGSSDEDEDGGGSGDAGSDDGGSGSDEDGPGRPEGPQPV
ncbi:zinc-dependent metalloprotease [Microbacterium luticocti]|uniref:zinc-dependent metalloprotease n=1 Tax=Microbacterium luticocti TaxID=451764 RepID=UPI000401B25F|nr:zinc-dependent metalloprotease [Microbacterium luticocti]